MTINEAQKGSINASLEHFFSDLDDRNREEVIEEITIIKKIIVFSN